MNSHSPRIVWMMDETIAHSHPSNWQRVEALEHQLVSAIGKDGYYHDVVHPLTCFPNIIRQLRDKQFSCIFDLTGWLTPAIQELFPEVAIENEFSLSRVRNVSSPRLETTGYRISMSGGEMHQRKQELDLSRPLIVDDAGFSGWTNRKTMELWGMNPENTTHAFLIANAGMLAADNPGAIPMLEGMGSTVICGHLLQTPFEDGWHLKDLHQNTRLERSFTLALLFQEAVKKGGFASELVQQFFQHETAARILFPNALTSDHVRRLMRDGKFVALNHHLLQEDAIHARNPLLWASPYFQEHIDIQRIIRDQDEVLSILVELHHLTSDPEAKREASEELKREVQRALNTSSVEGQTVRKGRMLL